MAAIPAKSYGLFLFLGVFIGNLAAGEKCPLKTEITVGAEKVTISSENFGTGDYTDYTHCRWFVTGPTGTNLKLTFANVFDVERSTPEICSDAVTVFDTAKTGSSDAVDALGICKFLANTRGPFCGKTAPAPLTLQAHSGVIQFCSDWYITGAGWSIEIEAIPIVPAVPVDDTKTLTAIGDKITISSPNYPDPYYNRHTAKYTILNANPAKPVYIEKKTIALGIAGELDNLTITDITNAKTYIFQGVKVSGPDNNNTDIEALEGLEFLNTEAITITLETDEFDVNQGFQFLVSSEQCPRNLFTCDDGSGCYSAAEACDGTVQCAVDGSDESPVYCHPECGKAHFPHKDHNRIVGGQFATRHSLPWQVAHLRRQSNGQLRQWCGGTIITDRWVLTAAHCFTSQDVSIDFVRVGGHDMSLTPEQDRAVVIPVERAICHPYYTGASDWDQCLLKLKEKIPFRKNIAPACMPAQGADVKEGESCMVSGWGDTKAINTDMLKQVFVPVVSRANCALAYPGSITDNMICAGSVLGGIDSCQGDSGGPFICKNRNGRWVVNGIVSWGRGCALPDYPGVYASTGTVTQWIAETIARNSLD